MDSPQSRQSPESADGSSFGLIVFAATAAITAALVGAATYLFFLKRPANSPQQFLKRCRHAIDSIENGMDTAGYA